MLSERPYRTIHIDGFLEPIKGKRWGENQHVSIARTLISTNLCFLNASVPMEMCVSFFVGVARHVSGGGGMLFPKPWGCQPCGHHGAFNSGGSKLH